MKRPHVTHVAKPTSSDTNVFFTNILSSNLKICYSVTICRKKITAVKFFSEFVTNTLPEFHRNATIIHYFHTNIS